MKFRRILLPLIFLCVLVLSGCSAVKPWQRVYLNDPEMQMSSWSGITFEDYVHSIRTGSVVSGSKKSSGGCGCN